MIEGHYYPASSVAFYTNRRVLLLNGQIDNLVYGAAAPGAPAVFVTDDDLARLWKRGRRLYLVVPQSSRERLNSLLPEVHVLAESGGKCLLSNR